jgi:ribonuclease HI
MNILWNLTRNGMFAIVIEISIAMLGVTDWFEGRKVRNWYSSKKPVKNTDLRNRLGRMNTKRQV